MGAKERGKRVGTDSTANVNFRDIIGSKGDAAAAGAVSTTESLMAYLKQLVGGAITRDALIATNAGPFAVAKTDGAALAALDPLFTITGGPVRCKILGLVTTAIVGATNFRLRHVTDAPSATVELNAGAVAVDNEAIGTIFYNVGATSVFTPTTLLSVELLDPVTVEEVDFILGPGALGCLGSTARDGVIAWYMTYYKLSPDSLVVAAA